MKFVFLYIYICLCINYLLDTILKTNKKLLEYRFSVKLQMCSKNVVIIKHKHFVFFVCGGGGHRIFKREIVINRIR